MTSKRRKSQNQYEQLAIEFYLMRQQMQSEGKRLTVKDFCTLRCLTYNTARIPLKKWMDKIDQAGGIDQYELADVIEAENDAKQLEKDYAVDLEGTNNSLENNEKQKRKDTTNYSIALKGNKNAAKSGIYSKYFSPELLERAASGTLEDDLNMYRAKVLNAMDMLQDLHDKHTLALEHGRMEEADRLEQRIIRDNKAVDFGIRRIESLANAIKKIELTNVLITKERANVVKTRAQTRVALQQTKKYRQESKLANAKIKEIEQAAKGTELSDIIRDIQKRRDLLPSMTKDKKDEQQ